MTFGLPCWWNWPEYENIQAGLIPRSSKSKMCLPRLGATSCPGIVSWSLSWWSWWGWLWWLWDSEDYNLKEDQGNEDYNLEVTRIIGSGDVDNDIWDGGKFPKGSPSSLQRKIFRVNVFLVIIFERSFFIYFFLEIICSGCFCELGNNCEDVSDRQ